MLSGVPTPIVSPLNKVCAVSPLTVYLPPPHLFHLFILVHVTGVKSMELLKQAQYINEEKCHQKVLRI